MRWPERLAAAALACVLVVVVASAAIRLGAPSPAVGALRAVHRTAATLEVLIVVGLVWMAWRRRSVDWAVVLAALFTVLLAIVGIAAGRDPPPAAAFGNIVGGLALAGSFAWMLGRRPPAWPAALVAIQVLLGATLAAEWRASPSELRLAHVLLGLSLALGTAILALRAERMALRVALVLLAAAVPAAGLATAALDRAFAPALAHAAAAALFIAAVAFWQPRLA